MAFSPDNRYALKEWAVVVDALGSGRQIMLLRKGGIVEDQGDFDVKHTEFFLYPTYLHEQAERIVPGAVKDLKAILRAQPSPDHVVLSLYSVVDEVIALDHPESIERIGSYHILSSEEVLKRFYYRDQPGLYLLLLRVYRLPLSFELSVTRDYAGCKSWVDLGMELSTTGCQPVLSDEAFQKQTKAIRLILGS